MILAFASLTLARDFLMPIALAMLLFFVFAPLCRALSHAGIPQVLTAGLVTLALLFGLIAATLMLAVPIGSAVDNAPKIFHALQDKLATLQGSVEQIQNAAQRIQDMATPNQQDATVVAQSDDGSGFLTGIAMTTPAVFGQFIFTLVLLFFTLASRDLLYLRTVQSFSSFKDKRAALAAMHEIEKNLGSYLGAITLINACLGVAVGLAMWAWGMPSPLLFGVVAFATNYVPYVGPIAGVMLSTLVAMVALDGLLNPLLVGATYLGLISVEGQFITPYFLSRRLRLNTVVVFVFVALFAWLWSAVGMVVAVPMLIVLNVVCGYVPGLEGLGKFLAGEVPEMEEVEELDEVEEMEEAAAAEDRAHGPVQPAETAVAR